MILPDPLPLHLHLKFTTFVHHTPELFLTGF
jgi:hypothetical protein